MNFNKETGYYSKKKNCNGERYLLINPPIIDTIEHNQHVLFNPGPIGLLRVANYLISNNNNINFYDFKPIFKNRKPWKKIKLKNNNKLLFRFGTSIKKMKNKLRNISIPDKILISSYMTYSFGAVPEIISVLKKMFPLTKIIIGGPAARLVGEKLYDYGVDEIDFNKSYYDADNFLPLYEIMEKKPKFGVLRLTKGCPNNCSYCAVSFIEGNRVINFGYDNLIKEFNHLYFIGFRTFTFWDSNILYRKKDLIFFLKYIKKRRLKVKIDLHYGIDFNLLDNEILDVFDKTNAIKYFTIPIESSIKSYYFDRFKRNKNHIDSIKNKVKDLVKRNYFLSFYVIMGMPDQNLDDILESILFGLKMGAVAYLMPFSLIPYTEEFNKYKNIIKDKDLSETNPNLYPFLNNNINYKDLTIIHKYFHVSRLKKNKFGEYYLEKGLFHKKKISLNKNYILIKFKKLLLKNQNNLNHLDYTNKTLNTSLIKSYGLSNIHGLILKILEFLN